jgi:hypothetical protein
MQPSEGYDQTDGGATIDRDLAALSDRLLVGVAVQAGRRRAEIEAQGGGRDLDLFIVVEERIAAELSRRGRRAA